MLDKAKGLPADQVFMDIEDAVAPLAKPDARKNIVAALNEGGYDGKVRSVRVNDWTTEWTYLDVIEVVSGAGANLDCIMLPKVQGPEQIRADMLLSQIEVQRLGRWAHRYRSADRERDGFDHGGRDRCCQSPRGDDHFGSLIMASIK